MKKQIAIVMLASLFVLFGCTNVTVDKPDGTRVTVTTWGSSQVSDMSYDRDADGIVLKIGDASNTPEGMSEVIEPIAHAATAIGTAGVSSAVDAVAATVDDNDGD